MARSRVLPYTSGILRSSFALPLIALVACATGVACGDSSSSPSSAGGGGTSGSAGDGGGTTSSSGGSSSVSTGGGPYPGLGTACRADADCDAGLVCVTSAASDPAFSSGGPAGGYCTRACETDVECGGGACLPGGADSKCFLRCERGAHALMTVDDALFRDTCHARPDLACKAVGGSEACVPTCGADQQCNGRKCDPKTSVCVDEPSSGLPINAACDPAEDGCAGKCIAIVEPHAFCSQPCAMGGDLATSFDCGGIDLGLCLYSVSNTGVGDDAYCTGACQTHEDCQQPDVLYCFDFLTAGPSGKGYCVDVLSECMIVGSACTGPKDWPGSVCTKTANGKLKCLDPTYPAPVLGTGGAGGAGGAGGQGGAGGAGGAGGLGGGGGAGGN